MKADNKFFRAAIILAREAFIGGYSPVGAVLVDADYNIQYEAGSRRDIGNVLHAEYRLLQQSSTGVNMTLYSTLEPCIMCSGMAAVMKVPHIKWLVDDVWAGASRVYNPDNAYIQKRFPSLEKIDMPSLHLEAQEMWVKYLRATGHADAVAFMLGLPEDYQCKLL